MNFVANRYQQIPIALFSSGFGVFFLTKEKIINQHQHIKSIEDLRDRLSKIESEREMTEEQLSELNEIESKTQQLMNYGMYINPFTQIDLGELAMKAGRTQIAEEHYQAANNEFRAQRNQEGEAITILGLGECFFIRGNLEEATNQFQTSLQIFTELGIDRGVVEVLNNLGRVAFVEGHLSKAEELFLQCSELSLATESYDVWDDTESLLTAIKIQQGDYEGAENRIYQLLSIIEESSGELGTIGNLMNNLGEALRLQERYEEAEKLLNGALEIFIEIGDRKNEVMVAGNLGLVYFGRGEFDKAEQIFQNNRIICQQLELNNLQASFLNNLGIVELNRKDFDSARRYFEDALKLSMEIGIRSIEAVTLRNLAEVEVEIGNLEEAERLAQISLSILEEVSVSEAKVDILLLLGEIESSKGNPNQEINYYSEAVNAMKKIGKKIPQELIDMGLGP